MNFSEVLNRWYHSNKRELPWRSIKDPYCIWLSEIILQQTRVEQGLPYYLKFVRAFPTITDLALATEDQVLKLWQGLGYYSRARNLHYTAKYILKHFGGIFPMRYDDILNLKGVGPYTAAAIASFAFGLPYAVVDGNVMRVLARIFGVPTPLGTSLAFKQYQKLAQDLLNKIDPAEHNQAIMEFGALQCMPKSPKCCSCPFASNCVAYNTNSVDKFPLRFSKKKVKKRFINYLIINKGAFVVLGKRNQGIWKGLYEFPFIEFLNKKTDMAVKSSNEWFEFFKNTEYKINSVSDEFIHKLSHQHIYAKFWTIDVVSFNLPKYSFVKKSNLQEYPVSRLIDKFIKEYKIN